MWKEELIKNKIRSLLLIGGGTISALATHDGTFFLFTLIMGSLLFFSKKNWVT